MTIRREAREAAVSALYMCDLLERWDLAEVEFCFEHFAFEPSACEYAREMSQGVISNLTQIDNSLSAASQNWSLSRMNRIDRTILRVATYEIKFRNDVPKAVVINEALELAKDFSGQDAVAFINGVLDRVGG